MNESEINKKIFMEQKRCELTPRRNQFRLRLLDREKKRIHEKTMQTLGSDLRGLSHDDYPSLWGYVVFNSIEDRNRTMQSIQHFNRWSPTRIFCNCLWTLKKATPLNYRLKGEYGLIVEEIGLPSNIYWDNQEVTLCQRTVKQLLSFFVTIILLVISLAIIYAASSVNVAQPDCSIDYAALVSSGAFSLATAT